MASSISLSFATQKMTLGYDTHLLLLHARVSADGDQSSRVCVRDDYSKLRLHPDTVSSPDYFEDVVSKLFASAALKVRNSAVSAVLASQNFNTDHVFLAPGVTIPILPSSNSQFPLSTCTQGAVFLRAEGDLIIWSAHIRILEAMYEALNHELQHFTSFCSCTVERQTATYFNPQGQSLSTSTRGSDSSAPLHPLSRRPTLPTLYETDNSLSVLEGLGHLNPVINDPDQPVTGWYDLDSDFSVQPQLFHSDDIYSYPTSLVDSHLQSAFLPDKDHSHSLIVLPSPLSFPVSPPTTSSSPQTVCFSDVSPMPHGIDPASPLYSDFTSPSSSSSFQSLHDDTDSESETDPEPVTSAVQTASTPPTTRQMNPSPSFSCLFTEPPAPAYFTFPPPSRHQPTGGKTKAFRDTTTAWRSASATGPCPSPAAKVPKLTPPIAPSSPAEDSRRNGRLSATATNTTPSLASLRLSSPGQPHPSNLHSPARAANASIRAPPGFSPRVGGSTPPRRAALVAKDAIVSSVSSGYADETAFYTATADGEGEDDDDGDDEYQALAGSSAILSPKSSAAKSGIKRKKRRSGGAVSQKKQKFFCDACNSAFTRDADMRRHRSTACKKAGMVESMTCTYCQVPFNRGDALNRHIRTKHRDLVGS